MAFTFDATLKDMGRESPRGFLATFDRPPSLPVKLLNVDLSTVTTAADLIFGLGDPLQEAVHLDFQASASAWKHADILVYNALIYAHYHVPVHSILVPLRPEAAHSNQTGDIQYAPRPGRGRMDFAYEIVRLWQQPAEQLLAGDLGVTPLAMLGQLPDGQSLEERLGVVARNLVNRVVNEAPPDQVKKLLADAYLLTGLRVRRDIAKSIFRGVRAMQESDTYLAILDEGQEKALRNVILALGEDRIGPPDESVKESLNSITDLERLMRIVRQTPKATSWREILDTP